ncbi:MAG: ceramidase domain-containing protein [Bdellovibrio sp.]|nr:ceramidase domain-containing protein [Bdellovibrio sp.]
MIDPWSNWQPAACMPDHCFCEAVRFGELIRQPSNTWSNLSFVLVASVLIVQIAKTNDSKNKLIRHKFLSYLYALSCLLVGLGSFFFHASLTFVGQWVDVLGMYLAITFFGLYNIFRIFDWKVRSFVVTFFFINSVLSYVLYAHAWSRRYLFALFVVLLIFSIWYSNTKIKSMLSNRILYQSIACFMLGVMIWILDITKVICDPYLVLQGHSLWHFLTALASYLIFRYYLSESHAQTVLEETV